ncbi:MAG: ABC transporter substrate-binding protein [Armatimonadota bacterium]
MKRIVVMVLFALVATMLFGTCASAQEIKIGGLFDLSGKASHIGIPSKQVANMVVDDINKKGGINGKKIKLIIADTRSEPAQAVIAFKKLVEKDKVVAVVGPTTTGAIMAMLPAIESAKIPVVALVGGAAAVVPVEERKWVFKSPQKSSSAVARIYIHLRNQGVKKIGLLTATDAFGQEGEELLKSLANNYGIRIVAHEKFDPKDKDMTVQIGKIAQEKPEAMIVWTVGPAGAMATKNARQLKVPFKIIQCHGQPDPTYIKLAGADANGTLMPSTKLMIADQLPDSDPQKKLLLNFKKEYEKRGYGEVGTHSGYAWDGIQLIANAIKKAGTNPAKIRDALENTKNYVGVSGIYNMSSKDHVGLDSSSLVMVEVVNGKWKLVK